MDHPNSQRALAYFDDLFPLDPPPMATQLQHAPLKRDIIADILSFDGFGAATVSETKGEIPYFVNEFWTSGQRQAHSIHEVSYRACFKAQLPEFFISRLTDPGNSVYDPFMGRGTTPVQAALQGRRPLGNDINPLSKLLVRPRLEPPSLFDVANALESVPWTRPVAIREDLLVF